MIRRSSARCSVSVITASGVRSGFGSPRRKNLMWCGLLPRPVRRRSRCPRCPRRRRRGPARRRRAQPPRRARSGEGSILWPSARSQGLCDRRTVGQLRRWIGRRVVAGLVVSGRGLGDGGELGRRLDRRGGLLDLLHRLLEALAHLVLEPARQLLQLGERLPRLSIASGSFSGPSTTRASRRMTTISLPERLNTTTSLRGEPSGRPA